MLEHLIIIGTCADRGGKLSPENREVLDIATTLHKAGYSTTLIFSSYYLFQDGLEIPEFPAENLAYAVGIDPHFFSGKKGKITPLPHLVYDAGGFEEWAGLSFQEVRVNDHPRDSFSQYGRTLHVPSYALRRPFSFRGGKKRERIARERLHSSLLSFLDTRRPSLQLKLDSPFGEGGRCVDVGDFLLASMALRGSSQDNAYALEGKPVYFVETLSKVQHKKIISLANVREHIDY